MKSMAEVLGMEPHEIGAPLRESIANGVAVFRGSDRVLLYATPNYHKYIGYSEEECSTHGFDLLDVLIHPDDADRSVCRHPKARDVGTRIETEYRIIQKGGEIKWTRCSATVVDSPVHSICLLCVFFDVTREHTEALAMRREIELLMNTIPGGVAKVRLDGDFTILLASDGFYALAGCTRSEFEMEPICGRLSGIVLPEDFPALVESVEKQVQQSSVVYVEFRILRKGGATAWIALHARKLGAEGGNIILEGVFIDTTETKNTERKLLGLTNSIPGGVTHLRISGKELIVDYASDSLFRMLGWTREEFMDGSTQGRLRACIYETDYEPTLALLKKQMQKKDGGIAVEFRVRCRDGETRWWRMDGVCADSGVDGVISVESVNTDITEAKRAQHLMEVNEARYHILFEHTQDVVFDWDIRTGKLYHSRAFEKRFGSVLPGDGKDALDVLLKKIVHSEDADVLSGMFERLRAGEKYVETDFRLRNAHGEYIWCRAKVGNVFDTHHQPVRAVGIVADIDRYIRRTERFQEQARTDLLTGLLNKVTTESDIEEFLQDEGRGDVHAFYLIDIDDFKYVNDTFGHLKGDAVLKEISREYAAISVDRTLWGALAGMNLRCCLRGLTAQSLRSDADSSCAMCSGTFAWREQTTA